MTVCIAAACEQATTVVCATDGALSYNGATLDTRLAKMYWVGEWMFMYAGEPGNFDLAKEAINQKALKDKSTLSREKVIKTLHSAFRQRMAAWSSDGILNPYDLDITEFKKEGKDIFGETRAAELSRLIDEAAQQYHDQLLVVGWGKTAHSVMIHEENKDGSASHSLQGFGAIGSGASVAMTYLLHLEQGRSASLADTIYAVAAAKFAAESADGVKENTSMFVTWKRDAADPTNQPPGKFIQSSEISILRGLWEEHGRPKIPLEISDDLDKIIQRSLIDMSRYPHPLADLHRAIRQQQASRRPASQKSELEQ